MAESRIIRQTDFEEFVVKVNCEKESLNQAAAKERHKQALIQSVLSAYLFMVFQLGLPETRFMSTEEYKAISGKMREIATQKIANFWQRFFHPIKTIRCKFYLKYNRFYSPEHPYIIRDVIALADRYWWSGIQYYNSYHFVDCGCVFIDAIVNQLLAEERERERQ